MEPPNSETAEGTNEGGDAAGRAGHEDIREAACAKEASTQNGNHSPPLTLSPGPRRAGLTVYHRGSASISEIELASPAAGSALNGGGPPSIPQSSESVSVLRASLSAQNENARRQILEDMTFRLASAPSDSVQRRKIAILNELRDNTKLRAENIFQSDQPLAMFLTSGRAPGYLLLLSCMIFLLQFLFPTLTASQLWSVAKYQHFRFVPLQLRNGSNPSVPGIFDFHMLSNGCMQDSGDISSERVGTTIVKSFPERIVVNGFVVVMSQPPHAQCLSDSNALPSITTTPPPLPPGATPAPRPGSDLPLVPPHERSPEESFRPPPAHVVEALKPVAFRVEGSDDKKEWRQVGSSTWAYNAWLEPVLMDGRVPEEDLSNLMEFDMRAPIAMVFFRTVLPAQKFVMVFTGLVLVMRGKAVLAAGVLIASFLFDAIICLVSGIALLYSASARGSFIPWVGCGFSLGAFLLLSLQQRRTMILVALFSALLAVATLIDVLVVSRTKSVWTDFPYVVILMSLVGVRWLGYYRSLLSMATKNIAADKAKYNAVWQKYLDNCAAHDRAELEALDGVNKLLRAVKEEVLAHGAERPVHRVFVDIGHHGPSTAGAHHGHGIISQHFGSSGHAHETSPSSDLEDGETLARLRRQSSWKGWLEHRGGSFVRSFSRGQSLAGGGSEGSLGKHFEEVTDLDQVYNQARGVLPFFRDKCWEWARLTNGMLPIRSHSDPYIPALESEGSGVRQSGSYGWVEGFDAQPMMRWMSVQNVLRRHRGNGGGSGARTYVPADQIGDKNTVAWTDLKSVDRTIHKVRRVYSDKASRVVDVVRERIAFESFSKLYGCLWSIIEDDEIDVRGVKNGLRENYNPNWSAGFRAVTLSISVQNRSTKDLALAQHVCELQLVLEPMLKVQASCNHRAYIIFREARSLKAASPFSNLYYRNHTPIVAGAVGAASSCASGDEQASAQLGVRLGRPASAVSMTMARLASGQNRRGSMMSTLSGQISPSRASNHNIDFLRSNFKRTWSTGSSKVGQVGKWLRQGSERKIELTSMEESATSPTRSLLFDIKADDVNHDMLHEHPSPTRVGHFELAADAERSQHGLDEFSRTASGMERAPSGFDRSASQVGMSPISPHPRRALNERIVYRGSFQASSKSLMSPLAALPREDCSPLAQPAAAQLESPSCATRLSSSGLVGIRKEAGERKLSWPHAKVSLQVGSQKSMRSAAVTSLPTRTVETAASPTAACEISSQPSSTRNQAKLESVAPMVASAPDDAAARLPKAAQVNPMLSGKSRSVEPAEIRNLRSEEAPADESRSVLASPFTYMWRRGFKSAPTERKSRSRGSRGSLHLEGMKRMSWGPLADPSQARDPESMLPTPSGHSMRVSERRKTPLYKKRRKSSMASLDVDIGGFFRRRGRRKGFTAPEEEEDTLESAMRSLFLHAVKNPGGVLDTKLRMGSSAAIRGANLISAFFTSSPITYTVGLVRIQTFLLVISFLFFSGIVHPASLLLEQGVEEIAAIRFEALGLQNGADADSVGMHSWELGGVRRVGLLRDGCQAVHFLNGNCSLHGPVFEQHWDPPVRANGWFILMDAEEGDPEEVREFTASWFEVESGGEVDEDCLVDDDMDECRAVFGGEDGLHPSGMVAPQNVTHREFKFDERPLLHMQAWAMVPVLKGVGFLAAAVCGIFRMEQSAVLWLAGSQWVAALALAVTSITLGRTEEGSGLWPYWTVHCLICLAYGSGLLYVQRHAVLLQGLEAACSLLLHSLVYLQQQPWHWHFERLLGDAVLGAVCLCMAGMRRRVLTISERLIQKDKESYDQEWERLLQGSWQELDDLKMLVDRFPRPGGEAPRQRLVLAVLPAGEGDARWVPGKASPAAKYMGPRYLSQRTRSTNTAEASRSEAGEDAASARHLGDGNGTATGEGNGVPNGNPGLRGRESEEHSREGPARGRFSMRFRQPNGADSGRDGALVFAVREMSAVSGPSGGVAMRPDPFSMSFVDKRLSDEWSGMTPVRSLDQIFAQAKAMHYILKAKVKEWAKESRGMVRRKGGGYREWREDDAGDAQWAPVKKPERAIEKVLRSYGGDASRLVDVCRQALVFETVADLIRCLEQVQNDGQVRLLRIKNRLDKLYDSALSAGYRDVAMNLIVCTETTRKLAVENHVCEFQLILKSFADLKSNEGHRRYVAFRNKRAE